MTQIYFLFTKRSNRGNIYHIVWGTGSRKLWNSQNHLRSHSKIWGRLVLQFSLIPGHTKEGCYVQISHWMWKMFRRGLQLMWY